ncbi:hypothetical protein D3C72_946940 [compost metagenome]
MLEDAQAVAQPLDRRAGDEDAAFERVEGRLAVELPGQGGQEAVGAGHGHLAGVHEHEAAGAVGVLGLAGAEAGLAEERGVLVAGHRGDGQPGGQRPDGHGLAEDVARGLGLRGHRLGDAELGHQLGVPGQLADVEDQRAAGVADVGGVYLAAREVPQQPGVDRAEGDLAFLRALEDLGVLLEAPADLGAREVGVHHQTGALLELGGLARVDELLAVVRGAAALPDDRLADRLAGGLVPQHDGLALVGDADAGDRRGVHLGGTQAIAQGLEGLGPDLFGVVLHPARLGVVLRDLAVALAGHPALAVEEDHGAAGGALIDRENVVGHEVAPAGGEGGRRRNKRLLAVVLDGIMPDAPSR